MSGLELPAFDAIGSAIKSLFEILSGHQKLSAEKKQQWFEEHAKKSYEQLEAIHEDYTKRFSEAVASLRKRTDLQAVALELRSARPHLLLKRQEVVANLHALRDARLQKVRQPKLSLLLYDYVAAVDRYLNAASPLPQGTWYTYFINTFVELVEKGRDPFGYDYAACAQGRDAPRLAIEQLDRAVQTNMPEAFGRVQEAFGRLRAECLAG